MMSWIIPASVQNQVSIPKRVNRQANWNGILIQAIKMRVTYMYHSWAGVYLSWAPVCLDKTKILTFQMEILTPHINYSHSSSLQQLFDIKIKCWLNFTKNLKTPYWWRKSSFSKKFIPLPKKSFITWYWCIIMRNIFRYVKKSRSVHYL